MKNLIKTLTLLGAVFLTVSACDDLLDVKPPGAITVDDVSTPENVEGLVLAAYAWIPHEGTLGQKLSPWLADIKSDDSYKGGGGLSDQTPWYQMEVFSLVTSSVGNNDGVWYGSYQGVSRANSALRVLNQITEEEYPMKNQRIAEVRFLRGMMFLQLKRWYKWIPYFDETVSRDSITQIPNHPASAENDLFIWENILDDFKAAAEVLPETQADAGRPTRYAAEAEVAEVLLWMAYEQNDQNQVVNINEERLTEAMSYIDDVINSDKYSLESDFANNFLFEYDNATTESIWEWQYSHDDGTLNGNLNGGTPLNAPWWPPYFSCCDFHKASFTLINAFRTDANGLPLFDTYNDKPVTNHETYFYDDQWDPRIGHTVAIPGLPWKYQKDILFDSAGSRSPAIYGYYNSLKENVQTDISGLVNLFWMWNSKNESAIKYNQLMLWKAEILIQLDREDEALPIINAIRQRAANSTDRLEFNDGSPTLPFDIGLYEDGVNCNWTNEFAWKALMWEDRLEFAMEGQRWYDIVRWGVAEEVMNAYFEKEAPRGRSWLNDGHFVSGRDEFMPIPQPQINYSYGVYEQNPGY